MKIEWANEMSVGVDSIDTQHKHFIAIMNELHDSANKKERKDIIGAVLSELAAFADYHFATEEKYFVKFDYKNKDEHIGEHQKIKDQVEVFIKRYKKGEDVALELVFFLEDWLKDHLATQDKKYKDCFIENGLK